jgi:hypothetical protein
MAIPYENPTPKPKAKAAPKAKPKSPAQPQLVSEHGAGQGKPAGSVAPIDWSSLLSQAGLPPNVINEVSRIFAKTPDLQQAVALGQAYIRSTPWYAATYPGIQSGINAGLFNDERGYKAYQNQLTQLTKQYLGRPATALEVAQHAVAGTPLDTIEKQYSGQAYVAANAPQIQQTAGAFGDTGALTQPELRALGEEQAGLDSPLGQLVQRRLQRAQERLQGAFKGALASPAMSLAGGRLAGTASQRTPDIGA